MSIDDTTRADSSSVEHWRAVLHDVVDQVLDEILGAAEDDWLEGSGGLLDEDEEDGTEDEDPPGDPPAGDGLDGLSTQLREGLAGVIVRGTRFWGCDGTLRCTSRWAAGFGADGQRLRERFGRIGAGCDCAVLHQVLGRTDVPRRCPHLSSRLGTGVSSPQG